MSLVCPHCREANPEESEFCGACSKSLSPGDSPRLSRALRDTSEIDNFDFAQGRPRKRTGILGGAFYVFGLLGIVATVGSAFLVLPNLLQSESRTAPPLKEGVAPPGLITGGIDVDPQVEADRLAPLVAGYLGRGQPELADKAAEVFQGDSGCEAAGWSAWTAATQESRKAEAESRATLLKQLNAGGWEGIAHASARVTEPVLTQTPSGTQPAAKVSVVVAVMCP